MNPPLIPRVTKKILLMNPTPRCARAKYLLTTYVLL